MELKDAMKEIEAILNSVYEKGFDDGATNQAILELRGRDKFIENLRNENNQEFNKG